MGGYSGGHGRGGYGDVVEVADAGLDIQDMARWVVIAVGTAEVGMVLKVGTGLKEDTELLQVGTLKEDTGLKVDTDVVNTSLIKCACFVFGAFPKIQPFLLPLP